MVSKQISWYSVHKAHGCGSVDAFFGEEDRIACPWPQVPVGEMDPKLSGTPYVMSSPPALAALDPRELWATQPWLLRHHVEYYTSGIWERTGETSADMDDDTNRFPIVLHDSQGRPVILTGHHRAAAALIEGRKLRVRWAANSFASRRAVLPLLNLVHRDRTPTHTSPVDAAFEIFSRRSVTVPDRRTLVETMRLLGLTDAAIRDRFRVSLLAFEGCD